MFSRRRLVADDHPQDRIPEPPPSQLVDPAAYDPFNPPPPPNADADPFDFGAAATLGAAAPQHDAMPRDAAASPYGAVSAAPSHPAASAPAPASASTTPAPAPSASASASSLPSSIPTPSQPPSDNAAPSPPPDGQRADAPAKGGGVSSGVLKAGTLIVIGAMAANVIGFRYSRFAVGKDVHRAWQNYERAQSRRAASSSSSSGASGAYYNAQSTRSTASSRRRAAAAAAAAAEAAARQTAAQAAARAAHAARAAAERAARGRATGQHDAWEAAFRGRARGGGSNSGSSGGGSFWEQTSFHVDMDPRVLEELLRARGRGNGPFGMPPDVLAELLRAAQAAHAAQASQSSRRRGGDDAEFNPFQFWERMGGGAQWADFEREMGGGSGGGAGGGARMGGHPFGRMGMSRHYSALGLPDGASDADVKTAYRKHAMKWHPDRYRGNDKAEADRRFREVTEAYNALIKGS